MKAAVRFKRVTAILVVLAVIVTTLAVSNPIFISKIAQAMEGSSEERKIAEDISNMTGVKTEEIMKLRKEGRSWNEVMETLKRRGLGSTPEDREARGDLLTQTGLGEEYIEKLKAEGYSTQDINEARMLAERIEFQLKEIVGKENEIPAVMKPDNTGVKGNEDEISAYLGLAEKFDLKTAVYLMLKLKQDFGSFEKVLDEYLYALQVDINLETCLTDKKEYEKEKQQKGVALDSQKAITVMKIEAKMLEKIQEENSINTAKPGMETGLEKSTTNILEQENVPKPPLPDVTDTKPVNPADEAMREINEIKAKSFQVEGR